ncbi:ornithine carbamoyltransferase [Mycoplasma todarodis]|uniref:ornithine carbamoyltransferase n=1 Tax=Mycoplasma todarodis TaxID=1937191 RepID=UPI003B2D3C4F
MLSGRNFTKLIDYSNEEINYLLDLSHEVKSKKKNNIPHRELEGKSVALLFQKDSTRTRCAFEVASYDLGMKTVYLGPSGSQFGKKESVEDSAKVLGSMFDGIQFRGYKQSDVEELAKTSGVPVWNGLTDEWHPTQMIADFMTIQEEKGKDLKGLKLVYVGDGRNNMGNSLMITSAKLGVNFVCLAPKALQPEAELIATATKIAAEQGSTVEMFEISEKETALANADVIYTDVWVSMGENDWTSRLDLLHPYQVNMEMMAMAKDDAIFLHCLPAFHGLDTEIGAAKAKEYGDKYPAMKNGEFEVTDAVIKSKHCKAFQEAENRLHSIKAIMLATMK